LTTSANGNFDFLSSLTLGSRSNTGAGVDQDSGTCQRSVSRQDILRVQDSILGNMQGVVCETLGLFGATADHKQEQMNASGSSQNSAIPSSQGRLHDISARNTVQPFGSNTQLVHVNLNVDDTGVPVLVGASGGCVLTGNVANGRSLNLIPATLPVQVAHPLMVPNVLYQSQVYNA
jgi:hypothetical protein